MGDILYNLSKREKVPLKRWKVNKYYHLLSSRNESFCIDRFSGSFSRPIQMYSKRSVLIYFSLMLYFHIV